MVVTTQILERLILVYVQLFKDKTMKNSLRYIVVFLLLSTWGCADYLDKQPDDMKTEEMVWTSRKETEGYLANVYAALPLNDFHRGDPWLGCSDEIDLTWSVHPTYAINLGNWSPSTNFYNKFNLYYRAIKSSLIFESNVHRCYELSVELQNQYRAEVKFLRGYYYWLLLKQYGPFALIDQVYPEDTDWNKFSRLPFDECVSYICDLMDESAEELPLHWRDETSNLGRPNKLVCQAVKSQVLLLAASPQWNGNKEYSTFKNLDGTSLANTNYEENKWRLAAEASKKLIDMAENNPDAGLKLYKNHENGEGDIFNPYKSYAYANLKNWNCEVIFGRTNQTMHTSWMIHTSPGPNNLGGVGPTQRVVDAFLMENGKPIEDPESGYIESGFAKTGGGNWNPNNRDLNSERTKMISDIREYVSYGHWPGEWNMYANREPRFYASILYNKRVIPQLPTDQVKRDFYSSPGQENGYGRVELYYGGKSRQSGSYTFYSQTGYLALKGVDFKADMRDRVYPEQYGDIYIRYAEILLNYIEALNEYDPKHSDIRKYWDLIRERAGVPSAFIATPTIIGDKEQQREMILRERQIELCFEGDRYLTTRRRWLAHTPDTEGTVDTRKYGDGGRMWGMAINAGNSSTNSFEFTDFYTRVPFETRVFEKSYYLFPIPESEIDRNKSMVQNPWW